MNRLLFSIPFLLVSSLPAADDPLVKGRELYDAAREAATGGQTMRDIAYDRATSFDRQGKRFQIQSIVKVVLPDTSRTEVISPNGKTVLVFDGSSVLNRSTGQAMPDTAANLQRRELARTFVLFGPLPAEGSVRFRGQETIEGRAVNVIELSDVGDTPLRLFLDAETRDVLKRVYVGDSPDGKMSQVEEILFNYKTVDGFRWPHNQTTTRNGEPGPSSTILNVSINKGLSKEAILQ